MDSEKQIEIVIDELESLKAKEIKILPVADKTSVTDYMVICVGTSTRHVKAIASSLIQCMKQHNVMPLGVEGEGSAEWVLVDLGDVIVHVMQAMTRDYYQLEKLWSTEIHNDH